MVQYKVKIDTDAFQMLNKHVMFLAKVSTKSARTLREKFFETIKSLDVNPERYPLWTTSFKLPHCYHKALIQKRYLILFYIDSSVVRVDYILDSRMDNNKFF